MKKYLAVGAALLAVSACNSSGGGGNETKAGGNAAAEAQGSAGGAGGGAGSSSGGNETIQPGLWEVAMRTTMNVPGMPQGTAPEQARTERECITPEETREMSDTFGEQPEGMQCSERQFTMRGGNMEGRMTCRGEGGEFRIRMAGNYTNTSFDFRQEMAGTMPGASQPMNMQIQARGRRVGECPPGGEEGERSGGSEG